MPLITPYTLTHVEKLDSLVEHRNKFNLDFCELNVFETHQQAEDFHLKFDGFTITSMLRGKKIMHLEGMDEFEYVPGETVLAPRDMLMRIDFPEARFDKPTQCTALVVDESYLQEQLDYLNERRNEQLGSGSEMNLRIDDLVLKNNERLAMISSRMIKVLSGRDPFKDLEADLVLKELILCLIRIQNLRNVEIQHELNSNHRPMDAIFSFIRTHLTTEIKVEELCKLVGMSKSSLYRLFTDEYGLSPAQLVLEERLKYAQSLLAHNPEMKIKEVAYASGFNDPNYFNRIFKRQFGLTPVEWRCGNGIWA